MSDCDDLFELSRSDKVTYPVPELWQIENASFFFNFIEFLIRILLHVRKMSLNNGADNAV